jgi:aminoglycoside phosphotransferase (APT) family kinase protein
VITDPSIPTLSAALDPVTLSGQLRDHMPEETRGLQDLQVRLLRHHAGSRCVLEISWRSGDRALSAIGKVYAKDRWDVYEAMDAIHRDGPGPRAEFSIPRPLAYVASLRLLLQEKIEGRPATESFLSADESKRAGAAERCGRWLAAFHAAAPTSGTRFDLSRHLGSMKRWVRRFADVGEPFTEKARELFRRLEEAAAELPRADLCTIHGDFSHHQVMLTPDRTVTVDWDKHRLADPGDDVAHFIVGLKRLAQRALGSMGALDSAAEVFLKTYLASVPAEPLPDAAYLGLLGPEDGGLRTGRRRALAGRLPFHRAAICLEHAKHDVHKQADSWREKASTMLDEGLRALAVPEADAGLDEGPRVPA